MPINYASYSQNVRPAFEQVVSGFQTGVSIVQQKEKQELLEAKRQKVKEMNDDLAALAENPNKTPEDYEAVMIKYPTISEHLQLPLDSLTDRQKEAHQARTLNVFNALESGSIDVAKKFLEDEVTASENAGLKAQADGAKAMLHLVENNTKGATLAAGFYLAHSMGAKEFGKAMVKPKAVHASAVTTILGSGGSLGIRSDGTPEAHDEAGVLVEGQARLDMIARDQKLTQGRLQAKAALQVSTARKIEEIEKASDTADKAFGLVDKIRQNITNLREVVPLVGQGANTGPIVSLFPSFKAETIRLESLQKRLGLDVVGAAKFGALSAGELKLALAVALPVTLKGDALIEWVNDSITAKEKLATYYEEQAIFLQDNSQADWLRFKRAELKEIMGDATEADITHTMKLHKMTRPEVLDGLRKRNAKGANDGA